MAEVLGIAGGVVSFVSLVGQVMQGVMFLHGFLGDIEDAPDDIQHLDTALKLLAEILGDIRNNGEGSEGLREAVIHCEVWVAKLKSLVLRYALIPNQSGSRKVWSEIGAAFRSKKFKKYINGLEAAKLMLLHAQVDMANVSIAKISGITTDIKEALSKTVLDHSKTALIVTESQNTVNSILGKLDLLPDSVTERVVAKLSTVSTHSQTSQVEILAKIRDGNVKLEQNSEDIKAAVQNLLRNSGNNIAQLASILQRILLSSYVECDVGTVGSKDTITDADTSRTPKLANEQGVRSLTSLSSTTTVRRWFKKRKTYKFWFGRLHIVSSTNEQCESRLISGNLQRAELLEFDVTFVPATWLSRSGTVLNIKRTLSEYCNPGPQFSLRPLSVIPWDHHIRQSFQTGHILGVQRAMTLGNAHLSSVFPDGSSLVLQCLRDIREGPLPRGILRGESDDFGWSYDWDKFDLEDPPYVKDTDTLSNTIGIVKWLIIQGSEIDIYNSEAVFSALKDIYIVKSLSLKMRRIHLFKRTVARSSINIPELDEMRSLVYMKSRVTPFYTKELGTIKETQTFSKILQYGPGEYFLKMISKGSAIDRGPLCALATLRNLLNFRPYALYGELNRYRAEYPSETFVTDLIKTAVDCKPWLAGDNSELDLCMQLAYRAIRGVLSYASPYFELGRGGSDSLNSGPRDSSNSVSFRKKMAQAVAKILLYDPQLVSYVHDNENLTDIALRWRTLDIWIDGLSQAGHQPFEVFDQRIWESSSHLYKSLGFVSCRAGTFVSLTSDSRSGRVCLLVEERGGFTAGMGPTRNLGKIYSRNPILQALTDNWVPEVELERTHCEVFPAENTKYLNYPPPLNSVLDVPNQVEENNYSLRQLENGELELIIECRDMYSPLKEICARYKELRKGVKSNNKVDENAVMHEGFQPAGVFSKVAEIGKEILFSIV